MHKNEPRLSNGLRVSESTIKSTLGCLFSHISRNKLMVECICYVLKYDCDVIEIDLKEEIKVMEVHRKCDFKLGMIESVKLESVARVYGEFALYKG